VLFPFHLLTMHLKSTAKIPTLIIDFLAFVETNSILGCFILVN